MVRARDQKNKTASSRGAKKTTLGHVKYKNNNSNNRKRKNRLLRLRRSGSDNLNSGLENPPQDSNNTPGRAVQPLRTQDNVNEFFKTLKGKGKCCSKATRCHSCLEAHFLIDNSSYQFQNDEVKIVYSTQLYKYITCIRTIVRNMNTEEIDNHIISEVRKCIAKTVDAFPGSGNDAIKPLQYQYDWKLELQVASAQLSNAQTSIHVCREVWAFAWGVSDYQLKKVIEAIKRSDLGYVKSSNIRVC